MKYVIGIDPGLTGAIAVLTEGGEFVQGITMPSGGGRVLIAELVEFLTPWIEEHSIAMVVIEAVHSHPGQGVASTFKFGRSLGAVEGAIEALALPLLPMPPQTWKARLSLPKGDKDGARQFAMRRWPDFTGWRFKGTGQALGDAACIALAWIERK